MKQQSSICDFIAVAVLLVGLVVGFTYAGRDTAAAQAGAVAQASQASQANALVTEAGKTAQSVAVQNPVIESAGYVPRAQDFIDIFKAVEALSFPGWNTRISKIVDMGDAESNADTKKSIGGEGTGDSQKPELLKEYGCNEYLSKNYTKGQNEVFLQMCRFDSPAGAYGAYTCFREGSSTVVRRGDGSSEDDKSISFWQNNYLVMIHASTDDNDECKNVLIQVANQTENSIQGHAYTPVIVSELPFMDRLSGSERAFMGPLSGRKFSSVHLTDGLILDKCIIGATADYRIADPYPERLKVMLIDYGNPATAMNACRQFVNGVCPNCGLPSGSAPSLFKLSGRYALCLVRGAKLGIVSNGRRAVSVAMLAHQFNW